MVRKVNRNQGRTPNYVFKRNDIVYIVVDGTKEVIPGINGVYTNETISWLDAQLTKYAYNKVVILQHFPLANKPSNDLYYTYNTLPYLQMLSKHNNVIAIVTKYVAGYSFTFFFNSFILEVKNFFILFISLTFHQLFYPKL